MPAKPTKPIRIVSKSPLARPLPVKANYHDYYFVDVDGSIFSFLRKRWLKSSYSMDSKGNKTGYICQSLNINTISKRLYVHRIVAEVYLPNPDKKPWVNHKDGNRSNNYKDNLEWSTISENIQHSYESLGRKASRPKKSEVIKTPKKIIIMPEIEQIHWLDRDF